MNTEAQKLASAKYRQAHRDKILAQSRLYTQTHKEEKRLYTETHKEEKKVYDKRRRETNREARALEKKIYRESHLDHYRVYGKNYYATHKLQRQIYKKYRWDNDPFYRLAELTRSRLVKVLRAGGYRKTSKTTAMLGCSWEELRAHLEKQFWPGMSWANLGDWQLDHKIPLASAKTEPELLNLCHYNNIQPLWADDNCIKSDRCNWTKAESIHPSHENDY